MQESIIFAGFGGQGVILAGKLLCIASMKEGKNVSHIPSYGAEMRGGTANCSVIISDEDIASPIISSASICVIMNKPSLLKFESKLKKGGLLIYNTSLIEIEPSRKDIEIIPLAANALAEEVGTVKSANMVTLGRLLKARPALAKIESLIAGLAKAVSARNKELNILNEKAIRRGFDA